MPSYHPYANHIASSGSATASRGSRLQPYVIAPATLCDGACNPNQVIEFIDLSHSPKNLLIRAARSSSHGSGSSHGGSNARTDGSGARGTDGSGEGSGDARAPDGAAVDNADSAAAAEGAAGREYSTECSTEYSTEYLEYDALKKAWGVTPHLEVLLRPITLALALTLTLTLTLALALTPTLTLTLTLTI